MPKRTVSAKTYKKKLGELTARGYDETKLEALGRANSTFEMNDDARELLTIGARKASPTHLAEQISRMKKAVAAAKTPKQRAYYCEIVDLLVSIRDEKPTSTSGVCRHVDVNGDRCPRPSAGDGLCGVHGDDR